MNLNLKSLWRKIFAKKQDPAKPYKLTVIKLINIIKKVIESEAIEDFTKWTDIDWDDKLLAWLRRKSPAVLKAMGLLTLNKNDNVATMPVNQAIFDAANFMRILDPKERTGLYIKLGGALLKQFPLMADVSDEAAEDQVQMEYFNLPKMEVVG